MLKINILLIFSLLAGSINAQMIENVDYSNPKTYEIGGITINGTNNLNDNALINISGLSIGEKIKVPSDRISSAITKLWKQGIFSEIEINIDKIQDNIIFINIEVKEYPRLSKFKFKGKISKSDISTLKEDLKLIRGKVLTNNLINNSINKIIQMVII